MFEERETNLEMQSRICGKAELQVEWRLKANVLAGVGDETHTYCASGLTFDTV